MYFLAASGNLRVACGAFLLPVEKKPIKTIAKRVFFEDGPETGIYCVRFRNSGVSQP